MTPPSKQPEQFNAYQRAYRAKNRQKWREYGRAWAASNAEKERERQRVYREKNREAIREKARQRMREKRAKDREASLQYTREYRAKNSDKARQWDAKKKAQRRGAIGAERISAECWDFIKAMHSNRCAYCGADEEKLQMDHVVALARGGTHTVENIVPACGTCNTSKNAKDIHEWIGSFQDNGTCPAE